MSRLGSPLCVTDESKLVGWLCFARHQWSHGVECVIPNLLCAEMIRRGWMKRCDGRDGCEGFNAHMTDKGVAVTDLHAAEWGIDAMRGGGAR